MTTDFVIVRMAAAALAIVFVVGAWHKLRDLSAFEGVVTAYDLVPPAAAAWVARSIPVAEIVAALCLVGDSSRMLGAYVGGGLLVFVTAAIVLNLRRGRRAIDCGCGGIEDELHLSWALVARNAVLGFACVALLDPPSGRSLAWLDYLTIGIGAGCLYGVYATFNQLLANAPRLARLRGAT
jgi:hypothetical protein